METRLLKRFNRTVFLSYIVMIIIIVGVFYKEILNSNRIYLDSFHDHMRMQELWLINHQSAKKLSDIEGPDIADSYLVDLKGNIKHHWKPEFKVDPQIISATRIGLNPELDADFDFDDILPDFSGEDDSDNDPKTGDKNNEGIIDNDDDTDLDQDFDNDNDKDHPDNDLDDMGDLDFNFSYNEIEETEKDLDEVIKLSENNFGLNKSLIQDDSGEETLSGQDDLDLDFDFNMDESKSKKKAKKTKAKDDDLDFGSLDDDFSSNEESKDNKDDIELDDIDMDDNKESDIVDSIDKEEKDTIDEKDNAVTENKAAEADDKNKEESVKDLLKTITEKYEDKKGLIRMDDKWVYVSSQIALSGKKHILIGVLKNRDLLKRSVLESLDTLILSFTLISLLLLIVFRSIRKNVVLPANALLNHIKTRGRGTYANIHINDGWKIWFDSLSEVFAKNDELVAKLQDTIDNLDDLVKQRSQGLIEKNKELQMVIKELQSAQEKIILQEKMSSLGTITAGIAHELKNPLNFIINFAGVSKELLDDIRKEIENSKAKKIGGKSKEDVLGLLKDIEQNMEYIKEHGDRADAIIKNMLLQARSNNANEMEKTDLAKIISESVDLAIAGTRGVNEEFNPSVEIEIDNTLGEVKVIPPQISRAILNLVGNSCQAMLEKAKKKKSYNPSINVTLRKLDDKAELRIWDNGMGMTKDTLEKIFDPFFTTKKAGEGTGLGMAMVYDIIVNNHGGSINVDSKRGEFTEFVITLPIS